MTVLEGEPKGRHVLIVDDLVQTGGTLHASGKALLELGAASVSAYCTHGVFPGESWRRFAKGGDRSVFDNVIVTNSIPTTTDALPPDDVFVVLDICAQVLGDLDD